MEPFVLRESLHLSIDVARLFIDQVTHVYNKILGSDLWPSPWQLPHHRRDRCEPRSSGGDGGKDGVAERKRVDAVQLLERFFPAKNLGWGPRSDPEFGP